MAHHKFLEQASSGTLSDIKCIAHHEIMEQASSETLKFDICVFIKMLMKGSSLFALFGFSGI
jgi:hypothetical protein